MQAFTTSMQLTDREMLEARQNSAAIMDCLRTGWHRMAAKLGANLVTTIADQGPQTIEVVRHVRNDHANRTTFLEYELRPYARHDRPPLPLKSMTDEDRMVAADLLEDYGFTELAKAVRPYLMPPTELQPATEREEAK